MRSSRRLGSCYRRSGDNKGATPPTTMCGSHGTTCWVTGAKVSSWPRSAWAHDSFLSEKGEIQRWIAESAAEIQAARLMTLDAAETMDSGEEARVEIALIKFWGAIMLHNVIDRAIQVHGALGGRLTRTPGVRGLRRLGRARCCCGRRGGGWL